VFADDQVRGATHHGALVADLAAMLDPFTARRLDRAGIPAAARCLEVGAGSGSIAGWLADRVGSRGEVVATDADLSHVCPHRRVSTVVHNIATDPLEPLGSFDLIHTRLVLGHLEQRRAVLARLAGALRPGGVLVVEEFAASWDRCVMETPDPDAHRLLGEYHRALLTVLRTAGVDTGWGQRVYGAMREVGLVDVDAELWARAWHGGEAGCLLPYHASGQLRPRLIEAGMSARDLDRLRQLLRDPRLVIYGNLAVSTTGRRRAGMQAGAPGPGPRCDGAG
jgi:SAM-dependent methyltransferase